MCAARLPRRRRVQTAPSGDSKATGRRASPTRPRPGEPVHRARPRTAAARDPRPSATLSAALRPPTFKRRHVPADRQAGHFWRNAAKLLETRSSAGECAIARAVPPPPRLMSMLGWRLAPRSGAASLALAKCAPRRQGGPPRSLRSLGGPPWRRCAKNDGAFSGATHPLDARELTGAGGPGVGS